MNEQILSPESLLVVFKLNGTNFGIRGEKIREVLDIVTITFVPRSPDFIAGIINVRGRILTILDMANLLGLPSFSVDRNSKILFLENNKMDIGFMVKSLEEVKKLSPSFPGTYPGPPLDIKFKGHLIEGTVDLDNKTINLLDVDRLFKFIDEYDFNSSLV